MFSLLDVDIFEFDFFSSMRYYRILADFWDSRLCVFFLIFERLIHPDTVLARDYFELCAFESLDRMCTITAMIRVGEIK